MCHSKLSSLGFDYGAAACSCWISSLRTSAGFCKVGTGHNKKIDFDAEGFMAVTDSVHLLKKLKFDCHLCGRGASSVAAPNATVGRLVSACPPLTRMNRTFRYTMGQAVRRRGLVRLRHHGACLDCSPCIFVFGRLAFESSWEVQARAGLLQFGC